MPKPTNLTVIQAGAALLAEWQSEGAEFVLERERWLEINSDPPSPVEVVGSVYAYYDASLLDLEDGDPVVEWPAKVGPRLVPHTASPTFRLVGEHPAVRWTRTSDKMVMLNEADLLTDGISELTMAIVVMAAVVGTEEGWVDTATPGSSFPGHMLNRAVTAGTNPPGSVRMRIGSASLVSRGDEFKVGEWTILIGRWQPTLKRVQANGVEVINNSSTASHTLRRIAFGANLTGAGGGGSQEKVDGWIAEVVIYDEVLSDENVDVLMGYFMAKYDAIEHVIPPITPADFGITRYHWEAATLGLDDGDPVTSWPAETGPTLLLTSSTAPTKQTADGVPVVRFDSADEMQLQVTSSGTNAVITAAFVVRAGAAGKIEHWANTGVTSASHGFERAADYGINVHTGSVVSSAVGPLMAEDELVVLVFRWLSNGTRVVSVNGVEVIRDATSAGVFPARQGMTIGTNVAGGNRVDGDIAEVIVYNNSLNNANHNALVDWLMDKYGIS